jgi:hypothetical protein
LLDPIGLGLENFDGVGGYRTTYANGDAVDSSGELPDGSAFSSLPELASILATNPKLATCASQKVFVYGLGRGVMPTDAKYMEQIQTEWAKRGGTLRELIKEIVINDTFRFRRGEAAL